MLLLMAFLTEVLQTGSPVALPLLKFQAAEGYEVSIQEQRTFRRTRPQCLKRDLNKPIGLEVPSALPRSLTMICSKNAEGCPLHSNQKIRWDQAIQHELERYFKNRGCQPSVTEVLLPKDPAASRICSTVTLGSMSMASGQMSSSSTGASVACHHPFQAMASCFKWRSGRKIPSSLIG